MTKYLTAKQKAEELGITLSGLRKTRHLYKHIPKGPRKYLYFAEDPQDVVRPIKAIAPLGLPLSPQGTEGGTYPLVKRITTSVIVAQGKNLSCIIK